jgi:outer membrane murein-binding lipoprotein Lpp
MKTIARFILVTAVIGALPLAAQTPNADDELLGLIKDLNAKQTQLADNQAKMDSKVSDLVEAIRVARLLMSRAGGPHIAPSPGTNIPAQKPPPPSTTSK